MSLSAARRFAPSLFRQLRASPIYREAPVLRPTLCQRRSLFNFGKPATPAADGSEEDALARAKAITDTLMQKAEWQNVATHPGSLQAIQNMLAILAKKGIDVGSGKPPKFTDMMRLAADTEFRDAVTAVKTELKNAGVNLDDPELVKSIMSLSNSPAKP